MSDQTPKVQFDLPWPVEQVDASLTVTSQIYPVISIDEVASQGLVVDFNIAFTQIEGVDPTAEVSGLELRITLLTYEMEAEGVDSTADVTGLELRVILLSTEMEPEGIDSTAEVTGLNLKQVLIKNEMAPEGIDPTANVTGLELT